MFTLITYGMFLLALVSIAVLFVQQEIYVLKKSNSAKQRCQYVLRKVCISRMLGLFAFVVGLIFKFYDNWECNEHYSSYLTLEVNVLILGANYSSMMAIKGLLIWIFAEFQGTIARLHLLEADKMACADLR